MVYVLQIYVSFLNEKVAFQNVQFLCAQNFVCKHFLKYKKNSLWTLCFWSHVFTIFVDVWCFIFYRLQVCDNLSVFLLWAQSRCVVLSKYDWVKRVHYVLWFYDSTFKSYLCFRKIFLIVSNMNINLEWCLKLNCFALDKLIRFVLACKLK